MRWLPIEANPSVMTKYVSTLGGPIDIQFHDVLSFESWALDMIPKPVYAVLFLYPIKEKIAKDEQEMIDQIEKQGQILSPHIWHMTQVVHNACGTVGLIHAIANIRNEKKCVTGGFLDTFFNRVDSLDSESRGKALETDENLMKAHAVVEKEGQSMVPAQGEEVSSHFVTFVQVDGYLYELDGRKKFPINRGECPSDMLLQTTMKVVKNSFIDKDPSEIKFQTIAMTAKP